MQCAVALFRWAFGWFRQERGRETLMFVCRESDLDSPLSSKRLCLHSTCEGNLERQASVRRQNWDTYSAWDSCFSLMKNLYDYSSLVQSIRLECFCHSAGFRNSREAFSANSSFRTSCRVRFPRDSPWRLSRWSFHSPRSRRGGLSRPSLPADRFSTLRFWMLSISIE